MTAEKLTDLRPLVELVRRLRGPDGCPWDQRQKLPNTRAYLLEEAHEVADAIDSEDWDQIAEELGDLLFQIVFISELAEEANAFAIERVIQGVHDKMVDRHPHVFGAGQRLADAGEVLEAWEKRKLRKNSSRSLLDGVARSLPALVASYRMTQKASGVGFDWRTERGVLAKVDEELGELKAELAVTEDERCADRVRDELGDLLFTIANLARKLDMDPEAALAGTNLKFRRRFAAVEQSLSESGKDLEQATLEEMDALWEQAKAEERFVAGDQPPTDAALSPASNRDRR